MQNRLALILKPRYLLAALLLLLSTPGMAQSLLSTSSFEYSIGRMLLNDVLDTHKSQSGTFSLKLNDPSLEIAMPFLWMGEGDKPVNDKDPHCCKHNFASIDFQLRKFQTERRDGLYAGLVLRGTTSNGYINEEFQRQTRWGAGATIGYRHLISDHLYWSTGITYVSYQKEFEKYDNVKIDTAENFLEKNSVTYDILKFGVLLP